MPKCPVCGKPFTRSDNMKRHIKNFHEKMAPDTIVHQSKTMHYRDGSCVTIALPKLIHPFTCLVAGPTGSGKTSFLRKLLELKIKRFINAHKKLCRAISNGSLFTPP